MKLFFNIKNLNYFIMKGLNCFFVLGLFIVSVAFTGDLASTYKVNTEYSKVLWTGFKVGSKHTGEVMMKDGDLHFTEGKLTGGTFVIDMPSIKCTDIKDAAQNTKLVEHLKSADFFGVEEHPTATYVIKKTIPYGVEKVKDQDYEKQTYKLVGDMTIKGITKTVKTQIDVYDYDSSMSGVARFKLDRSDFDIRYGSGSFFDDLGDKLIYDEIQLDVNISASKQVK